MKIAIIGAGHIGGALAKGLEKAGHHIVIGTRDPGSIEEAVKQSEVIIIAVPLTAIPDVAKSLGDTNGKIIIETSNAFGKPLPKYENGTTALKEITGNKNVVKCFNVIGAENLANPLFGSHKADAFVAGDSKAAKEIARKLAMDIGFEQCYDVGGDEGVPLLESMAMIWGALAYKGGLGRRSAFKILHE